MTIPACKQGLRRRSLNLTIQYLCRMNSRFLYLVLLTAVCIGCGGSLTDEQRKKVKETIELNTIRKVSEAQITEAAYDMGRDISKIIERSSLQNKKLIDSLQHQYQVKIVWLQPDDAMMLELEKQIVNAYTAGPDTVSLGDNIQVMGSDTLLYTKPIMKSAPDGSVQFAYALGIHLPRKQVVLSIKE